MNVSKEGHDQGFTHAFISTFDDEASINVYIHHPAHVDYGGELLAVLDKVVIVDYVPSIKISQYYK